MLASKLGRPDAPERNPEPREPAAGQSARFRIKLDPSGRVVPEITRVDDDEDASDDEQR
ncbi:MAG: hypothetical protein IPH07_00920 [Deltaproteobacteria bacterium]|nr:hypothetical protein [Deltaproteobacteria bacterium]MBK8238437.1 hypothetical protein [Deltaproteobacteria bacterium]MBK8717264.1 hypothetical protein [Deltaproteobacteria bacterium]MBP7286144.1 hypothetical protein [Nannocystaceae bacterium]